MAGDIEEWLSGKKKTVRHPLFGGGYDMDRTPAQNKPNPYRTNGPVSGGTYSNNPFAGASASASGTAPGRVMSPLFGQQPTRGRSRQGFNGGSLSRRGDLMEPPGWFDGELADYLAQAMGLVGSSSAGQNPGNVVDARMAAARKNAAEGDAKIAAMYAQLDKSLRGDIPEIAARTEDMQQALNDQNAISQQSMDASRDNSRSAEAANISNTQIGDSNLLAQQRDMADSDLAFASGQLNDDTAARVAQAVNNGSASEDLLRGNIGAVGLSGVETRAQNQRGLEALLAQLEDERAAAVLQWQQQNASNASSDRRAALGLAQDMYNSDYGRFQDQQNWNLGLDDRAYDRAMQERVMQNDNAMSQYEIMMDQQNNQPQGLQPLGPEEVIQAAKVMGINDLQEARKRLSEMGYPVY